MSNPQITISLILFLINVVALAVGHQFDRFKLSAAIMLIFDILVINAMVKLI